MSRAVTGRFDSVTGYNWYCRICGKIHKGGAEVNVGSFCRGPAYAPPIRCDECGNTEIDEGFGCSGDGSISNTTVEVANGTMVYTRVGTIDKPRRH